MRMTEVRELNKGIISQIIGPVIDIKFHPDEIPQL